LAACTGFEPHTFSAGSPKNSSLPVRPNRPELALVGAAESSIRPDAASSGYAVFDASGVRLLRAPPASEESQAGGRADLF
jgi:hypothetical protein